MGEKLRNPFIAEMTSKACQDDFYNMGVFGRFLLAQQQPYRAPTQAEATILRMAFAPYVAAYTEYLIRCATKFAPNDNDLGDSECFLYLHGDNRFLSSDRRWVEVAEAVCPEFYLDPERSLANQAVVGTSLRAAPHR